MKDSFSCNAFKGTSKTKIREVHMQNIVKMLNRVYSTSKVVFLSNEVAKIAFAEGPESKREMEFILKMLFIGKE